MRLVVNLAVAWLLVASALVLPSASAEENLSETNNVLYGIRTDGAYWVTPVASDPNEGGQWGSGIGAVVATVPVPYAPVYDSGREWVLGSYRQAGTVEVDPDGTMSVSFDIGAPSGAGMFDVAWELSSDGAVVASGEAKEVTTTQDMQSVSWSQAAGFDVLDTDTMSFRVFTTNSVGAGQRLSFDSGSRVEVTLPVIGGGGGGESTPQTLFDDLQSPSVGHAFENATSDTYVLNFTNEFANVTASFAWSGTGSVGVQLNGPDGVIFEETFDGDGSQAETFEGVPSGAWNLTLAYSNFTGSFDFALEDTATAGDGGFGGGGGAGGDGDTGGAPGSGDDGADGNATGNETVDGADDKGSPGLPMLLGIGVVALVAALRRRR